MPNTFEEVERTESLLRDAVSLLSEPATTYSRSAAAAVVVESLRLYRRALDRQRATREALESKDSRYSWQGSLAELGGVSPSSRVPAQPSMSDGRLN